MSEASDHTHHDGALPGVPSGIWQIDPAHSVLGFAVRHLMSKVRGTFNEFSGHITIAEVRLQSAAQIEIALASVNTGNEIRDKHLRTSDFFDVEQHPTMTFASTVLRQANESWALDGELIIRDTTRAIQIDVDFLSFDPTGTQGEHSRAVRLSTVATSASASASPTVAKSLSATRSTSFWKSRRR